MKYLKRVVVTGVGLITSLGTGVEKSWNGLIEGKTGIDKITAFDCTDFPSKVAGEVKDFNPEDYIDKKEIKKLAIDLEKPLNDLLEEAIRDILKKYTPKDLKKK